MKQKNNNPLENKATRECFIIIIKGIEKTNEIAKIRKRNRSSIYESINRLKELKIIKEKPKHKGFIINYKIANKYISNFIKIRMKEIYQLQTEILDVLPRNIFIKSYKRSGIEIKGYSRRRIK